MCQTVSNSLLGCGDNCKEANKIQHPSDTEAFCAASKLWSHGSVPRQRMWGANRKFVAGGGNCQKFSSFLCRWKSCSAGVEWKQLFIQVSVFICFLCYIDNGFWLTFVSVW